MSTKFAKNRRQTKRLAMLLAGSASTPDLDHDAISLCSGQDSRGRDIADPQQDEISLCREHTVFRTGFPGAPTDNVMSGATDNRWQGDCTSLRQSIAQQMVRPRTVQTTGCSKTQKSKGSDYSRSSCAPTSNNYHTGSGRASRLRKLSHLGQINSRALQKAVESSAASNNSVAIHRN